jgi:hypothetical protein
VAKEEEAFMIQKNTGANFEIKIDGKSQTYRDQKETAIEASKVFKRRQPQSGICVRDVRDNSVTVIQGETAVSVD